MLVTGSGYSYHNVPLASYANAKEKVAPNFAEEQASKKETKKTAQTQSNVFHEKEVEKLAEKISTTQLYTKEASTAIAKNMLAYKVEFLA